MCCIQKLPKELWFIVFDFSELEECVVLGWSCRGLARMIRSYLSVSEAWKGRVPPGFGLEVSDRVGGYFHFNEGGYVVLSLWSRGGWLTIG